MRRTEKAISALCALALCVLICVYVYPMGYFTRALPRNEIAQLISAQMRLSYSAVAEGEYRPYLNGSTPCYTVVFFTNGCRYTVEIDAENGILLSRQVQTVKT